MKNLIFCFFFYDYILKMYIKFSNGVNMCTYCCLQRHCLMHVFSLLVGMSYSKLQMNTFWLLSYGRENVLQREENEILIRESYSLGMNIVLPFGNTDTNF